MKRTPVAVVLPVVLMAGAVSAQTAHAILVRIGLGGHAASGRSYAPAGTAAQGYLGIGFRDVSDDRLAALKLKEPRGVEIIHVDHDGPAGQAGLREHDVILQMNGQPIEGEEQLRRILRETPVGRAVNLVVSRDGLQITVATQMADRTAVEREAWQQHIRPDSAMPPIHGSRFYGGAPISMPAEAPPITAPPDPKTHAFLGTVILGSSYTGAAVEMVGPQLAQFFGSQGGTGLLVRSVEPNTPAAAAGMRAGDVVVRANAVILASLADWARLVHENRGRPLSVVIVRDKQEQTLVLVPDSKKRSALEFPNLELPNLELPNPELPNLELQDLPLPGGTPASTPHHDQAQAEHSKFDEVN